MYFQYDNSGTPLGFVYNGIQYFYVTNQMGDVLGITEANGNLIAQYLYDDWGKLIAIDTADEEASTAYREIAEANPLRYRGYYYDNETGYYYLQSRYYDPEICRFINVDDINYASIDTSVGFNLFVYCENDSVNKSDNKGTYNDSYFWSLLDKFLKNYLLRGKSVTQYSKTTVDEYNLFSVKVYYKKSKRNTNALFVTFGDRSAWKKNTTWLNNIGKNQKAINNYYNKVNSVMTSGAPMTAVQASKSKATVISSNIGMGIQILKSGFTAKAVANRYEKIWGKKGIDYNNKNKYVLFWVTKEIGLNGLYLYKPSNRTFSKFRY